LTTNTVLPTEVSAELTAMFMGLAMPADAAENPAVTKRLYADALAGLPAAETIAVLRLYRIGDLGDGTWCPKPGEIRQTILARLERRADADRMERIIAEQISARSEARGPQSEEARAHVQAMVDQFKAGVPQERQRAERPRFPTEDEAKALLANPPAHLTGPVSVSPELKAKLAEITAFAREVL
jgi:hypothetical protein